MTQIAVLPLEGFTNVEYCLITELLKVRFEALEAFSHPMSWDPRQGQVPNVRKPK